MANEILTTGGITMPKEVASGIWKKSQKGSVIAALCGQEPQKFGEHDIMTFDTFPRAELVAEAGEKSSSEVGFGVKTVKNHKVQVTVRFTDEVKWADEDYQLGVLETLGGTLSSALSRALDLTAIHAINPLTGAKADSITDYMMQSTNIIEAGKDPDLDIESAAGLIIADGFRPTGIALDLSYAWQLATCRYPDGRKKYPEIGLTTDVSSFAGINASTSDTVSGGYEIATPSDLLGIVGDWSTLRWGVQRKIGVKMIEYGDPDGKGDLQRNNQIALRAEAVFGWAYLDKDAFALIKKPTA